MDLTVLLIVLESQERAVPRDPRATLESLERAADPREAREDQLA